LAAVFLAIDGLGLAAARFRLAAFGFLLTAFGFLLTAFLPGFFAVFRLSVFFVVAFFATGPPAARVCKRRFRIGPSPAARLHRPPRTPANSLKAWWSLQILRVLSLAAIAAAAYQQGIVRPEVVQIRAVLDGHTIDVAGYGRVRLAGIRAPRPPRGAGEGEPFGREARERLEGMVTHRFVRLEFPSSASRSAAYVLLEDGTFVNATLVRDGLARVSGRPSGPRAEELQRAQASAQQLKLGLWR